MTEFEDWKADLEFIGREVWLLPVKQDQDFAIYYPDKVASFTIESILMLKVWWLNPPGRRSSRVSVDFPALTEDKCGFDARNMVAGWRCEKCRTTLFGTNLSQLVHSPCCDA